MENIISLLTNFDAWVSLVTLTSLEIVLGVDNIVMITILAARLPRAEVVRARRLGLFMALFTRIGLLFCLSWLVHLTEPVLTVAGRGISVRDMILIAGGIFLIAKSSTEIFKNVEDAETHDKQKENQPAAKAKAQLISIIFQIMVIDIVFSLDSIITAVGMAQHFAVMVAAIILSVFIMIGFARAIGDFIEHRPSIKVLALAFLVMIGVLLVAEGLGEHLNKGYVYFGMAFSLFVEYLNIRNEKRRRAKK